MRRFPRAGPIISVAVLVLAILWLAYPRIAGTPDWLEHLGLLGWLRKLDPLDRWAVALTTFAAVIVALFQDWIRDFLAPVRLELKPLPGISIPWSDPRFAITNAYHFRLGVTCRSWREARFVEILVTDLW